MKTVPRRTGLWLAAISALTVTAYAQAPAPAAARQAVPAWPLTAVADPTTLGFTKAGLDALDARLGLSTPPRLPRRGARLCGPGRSLPGCLCRPQRPIHGHASPLQ